MLLPVVRLGMVLSLTIKIKNLRWGQHWSILTFDISTIQEICMKEISSMDFPQHGEVFYFYGQAINKKKTHVYQVQTKHLYGLCYGFEIPDEYT
jgi:hypothetical protein